MRGRFKKKELRGGSEGTMGLSLLTGETAEPDIPPLVYSVQDTGGRRQKGSGCALYNGDKVYLGVRVKKPVRDLLRNIRLAQGWEPEDFQETCRKRVKGDKRRVKTRVGCRATKIKCPKESLEELEIIIEVLEEDLRTCNSSLSPSQKLSCYDPPVSPEWSPAGYNSEESDDMIPSPQSYGSYSPGGAECYKAMSPPGFTSPQPVSVYGSGREEWFDPLNHDWNLNDSEFFWTQLQREECQLRDISDAVLLATDELGRTKFHKMACVGKRALGYAIAKRMVALNSLDLTDSDGMTALLHAANHNHHLMVADLIRLGANVNATNNSGKSCLHLSAEKGYVRVLEVLKHTMMDGVYVDVEATDNCGMSVLQCASLALKATVCELESSKSPGPTRLHTLRQEQMMETLECVLHMGSYLHAMASRSIYPRMG